jgi:hypothetical protein
MPKCKNCGENITKFDKEICPYCGCKHPLDEETAETCDVTQTIETMENTDPDISYEVHKKNTSAVLGVFLGIFGADAFYLGFKNEGILRCILSVLGIGIAFVLFYFAFKLSIGLSIGFACLAIYIITVIVGVVLVFTRKKDKNGVYLR